MASPRPVNERLEPLAGLIERVTFHNPENGFAVLRVRVKGRRDLATVVGNLATATAGEWLQGEGCWVRDRDHGMQFRAERLATTPPTSREGIEKYLGSGMIRGIGPHYAAKLVEKFGVGVLDVIEHESARIEEIEGIGATRRKKIKQAWQEQKTVRDIMVFLHSHGVGTSRAVRIFKTYGDEAIAKVRENPYRLARDIHGIGFATADGIAGHLGIGRDSLMRVAAGLSHVLLEASGEGHCALPEAELLESAVTTLQVDAETVSRGLERAIGERSLVRESLWPDKPVYTKWLHFAECALASALRELALRPPAHPGIDMPRALQWYESTRGITLADSQREALARILGSRLCVLTGGPGVGKTTLVDAVVRILTAKRVACKLCAPTGRAAKRMSQATGAEATTIHRLLEFRAAGKPCRHAQNPLDLDCLIVDEASMIDLPLMHRLVDALPARAHLLVVGDIDQLPSVGPGQVLTDLLRSGMATTVELTEIFRQAEGSGIIANAHRINAGTAPTAESANDPDGDFFILPREAPGDIHSTVIDLVARRLPARYGLDPVHDIQVLVPMHRGALGVAEFNASLQRELNPPTSPGVERFGWEFRVGDKVIQLRNDYDKEVFNGDIGRVARVDDIEGEVVIRYEGRDVVYQLHELDEVSPAYAISIHKSQGSEFPCVVIPLATSHYLLLQRNLLYTAVTRARKLAVLVGQQKALSMAVHNAVQSSRYGGLARRLGESELP